VPAAKTNSSPARDSRAPCRGKNWIFPVERPIEEKIGFHRAPAQSAWGITTSGSSTDWRNCNSNAIRTGKSMKLLQLPTAAPGGIGDLAEQRLRESPYFFLKSLRCDFNAGVLTLRGRVPHRQLKRFAESIVSRVDGVEEIINRVEIFDPLVEPIAAPAVRNGG
jgi:BON domain-containing protein